MKQSLDFIVIAAEKTETTALFGDLRRHPAPYLPSGILRDRVERAYSRFRMERSCAVEQRALEVDW